MPASPSLAQVGPGPPRLARPRLAQAWSSGWPYRGWHQGWPRGRLRPALGAIGRNDQASLGAGEQRRKRGRRRQRAGDRRAACKRQRARGSCSNTGMEQADSGARKESCTGASRYVILRFLNFVGMSTCQGC